MIVGWLVGWLVWLIQQLLEKIKDFARSSVASITSVIVCCSFVAHITILRLHAGWRWSSIQSLVQSHEMGLLLPTSAQPIWSQNFIQNLVWGEAKSKIGKTQESGNVLSFQIFGATPSKHEIFNNWTESHSLHIIQPIEVIQRMFQCCFECGLIS